MDNLNTKLKKVLTVLSNEPKLDNIYTYIEDLHKIRNEYENITRM